MRSYSESCEYYHEAKRLAQQRNYDEAIVYINEAIRLASSPCFYYWDRAEIYIKLLGKEAEAITDYAHWIKIMRKHLPSVDTTFLSALREILFRIEPYNDLSAISKLDLFAAIKLLNLDDQILLLNRCLDKETGLGKRIWVSSYRFKPCSLENGTLKEICDYLKTIDPNFVVSPIAISVTTKSIFKNNQQSNFIANFPESDEHKLDEEKHGLGL